MMTTGQVLSFGPWTARSQGPVPSAGSSERGIIHAEAGDGLHKEVHSKQQESAPDTKMALTRSKTSPPDFVLASSKNDSQEMRHNPEVQRDRMNMFKRQLAANRTRGTDEVMRRNKTNSLQKSSVLDRPSKDSFVTRSMVEALREERQAGGPGEIREMDSLQIAAEDWPFVYFVVALDQMPVASEDLAEYKVGKPHTARERQRFLAARKRRIQQSREEIERIRESNIDMGLRLEPIRPNTRTPGLHTPQQISRAGQDLDKSHSKHPPTPISSGSSHDFPMHRSDYMYNGEQNTMEDMMCRGFSQWLCDNFSPASTSQPAGAAEPEGEVADTKDTKDNKPSCSSNDNLPSAVQLPDIVPEQPKGKMTNTSRNSAPSSFKAVHHRDSENSHNNNKKVHFAEGLPYIKGSGIPVPHRSRQDPQQKMQRVRPETTPYPSTSATGVDSLAPPWSAPLTSRGLPTITTRSSQFKPMPLPKIDIVSEIYDELIVKTIQSFLEREGYSEEKFTSIRKNILARLSATYPHLARHRAWRVVRKGGGDGVEALEPILETDDRNRLRLRPLHQGFLATGATLTAGGQTQLSQSTENGFFLNQLQIPHIKRQPNDHLKPRWVPVLPAYRPSPPPEDNRYSSPSFMAIDGRHIVFTPRKDFQLKTVTLPGATSDFRMGPLILQDDARPSQAWTHIIPSGLDE